MWLAAGQAASTLLQWALCGEREREILLRLIGAEVCGTGLNRLQLLTFDYGAEPSSV